MRRLRAIAILLLWQLACIWMLRYIYAPTASTGVRVQGEYKESRGRPSAPELSPHRCVFVFGLESSGTKFVATHIARAMAPKDSAPASSSDELLFTSTDGSSATCWKASNGHFVQHISLPSGSTCAATRYYKMTLGVDTCVDLPMGRWIADLAATMELHPTCTGIVVERTQVYGHMSRSIRRSHSRAEHTRTARALVGPSYVTELAERTLLLR
jgi:hypothetical protein